MDIASNIADLPEEELEIAEYESGAPSRVVISLEAQLAVVEVKNETLRIVEPNIAAEVSNKKTCFNYFYSEIL